ncbi:MAG: hypothetical protein Q4A56_07610 [Porphyromonadaceae bacterium]|nr:hypothetical protein [Porphyromonadaceae bacterium]
MLTNTKIYVGKHGSEIQEKAFELGWHWPDKEEGIQPQILLDPFIYFEKDKTMECGSNLFEFNNQTKNYREITFEELMAMKPKYSKTEAIRKKLIELREKIDYLLNNY